MDLKLKISQKEGTSMSSLVKLMCSLKCRMKADTHKGELTIEGMDDNNIENVIDSIDEAFEIVGVDIVPTVELPEPEEPVVTAESLEIPKIEFSNKEVEDQANKLMRIVYWMIYSNKAQPRDMCQYLMSTCAEILMKYSPRELVKFSVGDIVVCNYGNHPNGEVSGGHVHAVVCDIEEDGSFYAAPITKHKIEGDQQKYLTFEHNIDVDYTESKYTGGTILLKKGKFICPERVQEVVGKARADFFGKLLAALPDTFRFSHNDYAKKLSERYGDVDNDDSMLCAHSDALVEAVSAEVISDDRVTETPVEKTSGESMENLTYSDSSNEDMNEGKSFSSTQKPSAEDYIAELLASSLANLDKSKSVEEQTDKFLNCIAFQSNEKIIKQSFIVACEVKKIGYESIILELRNVYPNIKEENIKAILREEFNKWLTLHPDVKEKYPKISFMVLLKVFARTIR